ncbi:hypothetical protein HG535_0A02400 [Zygotorulaspora mrakii]|uniref:Exocyst complex component EXO84 n=1 Tax=Zygotorulaspora mrakii TaxID=42260 RepID=A0A7H9AXJ0_ZYGMR|nr:uncharacterized protein HG535_0A02400 [Zygotorulaspora mrakii]QLG70302.1 hypothetical protein HG535_0A02400 [Zygotorulaspora mrakii]
MVDFSLKKAKNNWKNTRGSSPTKEKLNDSPSKIKTKMPNKKNPYTSMKMSPEYSKLPTMDAKQKTKVASSMQRRLSMQNPNYVPPKLDYSMPLPMSSMESLIQGHNASGANLVHGSNPQPIVDRAHNGKPSAHPKTSQPSTEMPSAIMKPEALRKVLGNPNFNAKSFVHDALGDATAIEIDGFTSNLTDLASEVQEEAKENINRSHRDILTVNNDLGSAAQELKQLRTSINELNEAMQQLLVMAQKRLQTEEHSSQPSSKNSNAPSSGLLPPMRAGTISNAKRDRTSVAILERLWDNQLTELFKNVEGAQKYISSAPGRHVLLESADWLELNVATLKPLQNVHIFILNDMVLVAGRPRDKQNELVVSQCNHLKEVSISPDGVSSDRLLFSFGNNIKCLYQCRKQQEGIRLLAVVRRAKDDLREISQAEEENTRKIKESFTYLQSTQQTPSRESARSPIKGSRRSVGSMTPGKTGEAVDSYLLETITMSMHSRTRSRDMNSAAKQLKTLGDQSEEIDIELGRLNFDKATTLLVDLESQLDRLSDRIDNEHLMLHDLINLKIDQKRDAIAAKLSQSISNSFEISNLVSCVKNMIKLGFSEEGLDLFLQNRSNLIEDLVLQIGSFDNSTNYFTQIAVIRFQTMKKTVLCFQQTFQDSADKFSSILVNWCKEEVDSHFKLIEKQLLNEEMLSAASIKSSRKQIDGLKQVGLDFVYKLDEFIRKNSDKIL